MYTLEKTPGLMTDCLLPSKKFQTSFAMLQTQWQQDSWKGKQPTQTSMDLAPGVIRDAPAQHPQP